MEGNSRHPMLHLAVGQVTLALPQKHSILKLRPAPRRCRAGIVRLAPVPAPQPLLHRGHVPGAVEVDHPLCPGYILTPPPPMITTPVYHLDTRCHCLTEWVMRASEQCQFPEHTPSVTSSSMGLNVVLRSCLSILAP